MIVALDLGFGNTKVYTGGNGWVFPSIVSIPVPDLGMAGMGLKTTKRKPVRIRFAGGDFFVGSGAESWGNTIENLDFSRIASPETLALFYTAMTFLGTGIEEIQLVIGLPVPLLRDEAVARPALEALKARLVRKHEFEADGKSISFLVKELKGVAQPVGAWADWALDEQGRWASGAAKTALVGIVDIGFNTLDIYGIRGGKLEPRCVGGGKVGIRRYVEILRPAMSIAEAAEKLSMGQLRNEAAINTWLSEVIGTCEQIWSNVRLDLILLVGGGALLLEGKQVSFERAFKAPVLVPNEPILANARGLWRWAQTIKWQNG